MITLSSEAVLAFDEKLGCYRCVRPRELRVLDRNGVEIEHVVAVDTENGRVQVQTFEKVATKAYGNLRLSHAIGLGKRWLKVPGVRVVTR